MSTRWYVMYYNASWKRFLTGELPEPIACHFSRCVDTIKLQITIGAGVSCSMELDLSFMPRLHIILQHHFQKSFIFSLMLLEGKIVVLRVCSFAYYEYASSGI